MILARTHPRSSTRWWRVLGSSALGLAMLLVLFAQQGLWEAVLRPLFPNESAVLYPQESLVSLALRHIGLVAASSAITLVLGLAVGVFVTRPSGREFMPLATGLASVAQTFPPVAILALTYPVLGFGFWPSLVALTLYGLLPVIAGTISGLENVPKSTLDAAQGMGMTAWQTFWTVELPLATRAILGGIRTSVVVNVGTAAIGAAIGAGGLGLPIFAGLENQNFAYVLEGAISTALLALGADTMLAGLERALGFER